MAVFRNTLIAAAILVSPVALAQTATTSTDIRISIAAALDAAKAQVDGGILEAELESEGGTLVWEIDVVVGEMIQEVKVDAMSGEVLSANEKTIEGTWRGWFDENRLAAAQQISASLSANITKAETEAGGQIVELSLEEEDGRLLYEIEIDTASGDREMLLDPKNGKLIRDD
ncbi:PepSY domain-containing protein [Acuticoccus sp. M5D2P5]|uniref:PepSY domain-containing protein n=1 Tax=Acuticoccus kalidii TaxID=2910977 RepID=UPI001F2E2C15|nr:PepSY domain-containing protein [Acuticoccus kalidii]MCF3935284.1 PepSY domain-containing protein [Acuticoccus kalidii]